MRARALAAGVPLPPAGSFRDAVLQESLFRARNLRHVEVVLFAALVERIGHLLLDIGTPVSSKDDWEKLHGPLRISTDDMLRLYEAELYEERYLPSYQQAEAEAARKRRLMELERSRRDARAAARVAAMSEKPKAKGG